MYIYDIYSMTYIYQCNITHDTETSFDFGLEVITVFFYIP